MNNEFVKSFIVSSKKDENVFCFMNLHYDKPDSDVTSSYNFGYSLENMDSEELYKCILTAEKIRIALYCECLHHEKFYSVVDDIEICSANDDVFDCFIDDHVFVDIKKEYSHIL